MSQFRKMVMANLTAIWLASVIPTVFLVTVLVLIALLSGGDEEVGVPEGSVLVVDLSMTITDGPLLSDGSVIVDAALGSSDPPAMSLLEVTRALHRAATDDRIKAVLLRGSLLSDAGGSSLAVLTEVRDGLVAIKEAGKTIYGYAEAPTMRDYYVLSMADNLTLNPYGIIDLTGLSSRSPYLANALTKYGIGAQVIRVGEYKSFAETFTRNSMSPEDREQTEQLLEAVWTSLLDSYAAQRGIDANELRRLSIQRGFINAAEAENAGMINQIGYLGDVIDALREAVGTNAEGYTFQQTSLRDYASTLETSTDPFGVSENRIAVVYLNGAIVDGEGSPDTVGGDWFAREIRLLRDDPGIKAVVIRVNSPGGSAFASEQIRYEIARLSDGVPVVVSMGGIAASGGYWVASAGDVIFAQPNTITGSIGVFGLLFNVQELANRNGIAFDGVQTGPFADLGTISRPLNETELIRLQEQVNFIYRNFINLVANSRGLSETTVRGIAGGRVWVGQRARELALVDRMGGLQAAIDEAAKRAGMTEWDLYEIPQDREFLEELLLRLVAPKGEPPVARTGPNAVAALQTEIKRLQSYLEQFNDPVGIYARTPLWITAP